MRRGVQKLCFCQVPLTRLARFARKSNVNYAPAEAERRYAA
jgi:hypothetical protein